MYYSIFAIRMILYILKFITEEVLRKIFDGYQNENLKALNETGVKFGGLENRFGILETKVDSLETGFVTLSNKVDNNFEVLNLKIRDLGVLVEKNSDDIRVLAEQVADIPNLREEVRGNNARLDRVEGKVDVITVFLQNSLDPRIRKIEEVVF